MPAEVWIALGAIFAFALLLLRAQRQAQDSQRTLDELAAAENRNAIVEASREVSETADSRRDPVVHAVPDIVPADRVPEWLRRAR